MPPAPPSQPTLQPTLQPSLQPAIPPTLPLMAAPYGTWPSPIDAAALASASIRMTALSARQGLLHWLESRPAEAGRIALMAAAAKPPNPEAAAAMVRIEAPYNLRSRVHEYGGQPYVLVDGGVVFSNFADQQLYLQRDGGAPIALTPPGYRYADGVVTADGSALLIVREDHTGDGEPVNTLVHIALPAAGAAAVVSAGTVLFEGTDFVASPRLAPGREGLQGLQGQLAFISWNHPDMPWDRTTLHLATLRDGQLHEVRALAGAALGLDESLIEPQWDADGSLYVLSDRDGWWNLYRCLLAPTQPDTARLENVAPRTVEFGGPLWWLGTRTYALTGDGRALVRFEDQARPALAIIELASGQWTTLALPYAGFASPCVLEPDRGAAIVTGATHGPAVAAFQLPPRRTPPLAHVSPECTVIRPPASLDDVSWSRPAAAQAAAQSTSAAATVGPLAVSVAQPIRFPTTPAADGTPREAHAFFYPPASSTHASAGGELPPLLVEVHGGPTGSASPSLDLDKQFWTSRGFAVVDVNHGGSTGFGRAFRQRLDGQWGVLDVADAAAAVSFLVATGRVDARRVAIRGGSAGGFTVLASLAFTDRYCAGANYFGVSDLMALAKDTHKFESRYTDRLIAPLPEGEAVYRARSPLYHLEGFEAPLITLQGADDPVVPPAQSRAIVAALRERGVPVAYLEFDGEQHGFRRADTIVRAQNAELAFYGRVFGFEPAGPVEALHIENLPRPNADANAAP